MNINLSKLYHNLRRESHKRRKEKSISSRDITGIIEEVEKEEKVKNDKQRGNS